MRGLAGRAAIAIAAVFLASTTSACGLVGRAGEGPVTIEPRAVSGFSRVSSVDGIGVTVQIGAATSVQVSAQANILPIIATEVEGNTLRIHSTEGFHTSEGVGVTIVMTQFDGISLSGGSQGVVQGIATDRLDISLDGGASLTASGTVTALTLNCGGGANAHLDGLSTSTVAINASGGAGATVRASEEVSGQASGGAHVTVLGNATLNVESSGGASVTHG